MRTEVEERLVADVVDDIADIADVMLFLCSDGATPTSGAAVPVYGEA